MLRRRTSHCLLGCLIAGDVRIWFLANLYSIGLVITRLCIVVNVGGLVMLPLPLVGVVASFLGA